MMADLVHADLEALRRSTPVRRTRGPWVARAVFLLLIAGLVGVAYAVLQPLINPARRVKVTSPQAVDAEVQASAPGTTLDDVGWLEPSPFPTTVRPLIRGVLDSLEVLEGQRVEKDKTRIGTLRNLDVENAYETAKAELVVARAGVTRAKAEHERARRVAEQRLDLRTRLSDIQGELAVDQKEVERLRAELVAAEAVARTARIDLESFRQLQGAGGEAPLAAKRSAARVEEADARVAALRVGIERAQSHVERDAALVKLAQEGVDDPRALEGDVAVAASKLVAAEAALQQSEVALRIAKRNLEHLEVRAPVDGVVMRLESAPGAVVGPAGDFKEGAEGGPGATSSLNRMTGSLVSLYDPTHLQVRVDLLFGQVPQVGKGTTVTFTVDAIPGKTFEGEVHRMVHEADINQNALQVKLRVRDPDPRMRPEMLCRVKFEGERRALPPSGKTSSGQLRVPTAAVRDGAVFVLDPRGHGIARRVPVTVIATDGEWTIVQGDLGLSSKLILDVVEDGESVRSGDE
jgi:multidrug efflux pump subunit AcrA (membrane-fusion protein)